MKRKRTFKQNRIFVQNNPLSPRICPELAAEIGLNESILLMQYEFWIATEGTEQDGHLWVRKTVREIKTVFPFWGTSTINRLIQKLITDKYLVAGAFDEQGDAKNGRWIRFDFDGCLGLKSIRIAHPEAENYLCQSETNVCANLNNGLSQSGTNNAQDGTNNAPVLIDKEKRTLSAHALLMEFHGNHLAGPIPDGAQQGTHLKFLLEHYNPDILRRCYEFQLTETWRARVSWATVRSGIGAWLFAQQSTNGEGNGNKPKTIREQMGIA